MVDKKMTPMEQWKGILEHIQKRSIRNIEYMVYKLIDGKFMIIPQRYSNGQFDMAKLLLQIDIQTFNFDKKIEWCEQYLHGRDRMYYLGCIHLLKELKVVKKEVFTHA